jgi:hypothetical protein
VSGQLHGPAALPQESHCYPLERRLDGPKNRYGRHGENSCTCRDSELDPSGVQPVASYTDPAILPSGSRGFIPIFCTASKNDECTCQHTDYWKLYAAQPVAELPSFTQSEDPNSMHPVQAFRPASLSYTSLLTNFLTRGFLTKFVCAYLSSPAHDIRHGHLIFLELNILAI